MKRILIVEHEQAVQTLLEYTITPFEDVDVDWCFAQSAQEALVRLDQSTAQLILVDMDLPDLADSSLCDHLSRRTEAKILLLVPMGQSAEVQGCRPEATINKPFEPNELRLLLGKLLEIHVEL